MIHRKWEASLVYKGTKAKEAKIALPHSTYPQILFIGFFLITSHTSWFMIVGLVSLWLDTLKYQVGLALGMAMGRVISGTRPAPPLMGWDIIFLNGFGIFFETRGGFGYCPTPSCPAPIIYKIKIKFKFNLKFKI